MNEQGFDYVREQVNTWVGMRLLRTEVSDGVCYYHGREKVLKVVQRRAGYYIQFNLPVPEYEGVRILSQEEARAKKLGKTRWIYRGFSAQTAEKLVRHVLASLPRRRVIDPAMSRDIVTFYGVPSPNFREIERLLEQEALPPGIVDLLHQAYDLLQEGKYVDFVVKLKHGVDDIVTFLFNESQGGAQNLSFTEKLDKLEGKGVISKPLREEIDVLFIRETNMKDYTTQDKAYPLALLLIVLMSKLLKVCVSV